MVKFREIIKNVVRRYPQYNARHVIDQIRSYSYVSFDVFDTLVKRSTVNPSGVFELLGLDFRDSEFRKKRVQAEIDARKQAETQGREEICIEEIYECMPEPYCSDIKRWISLELEKEMTVCYCNQTIKEVYDWCLEKEKHVLIISDMYVPKTFLAALLEKCGYSGYETLYLSSEVGSNKKSGHLFQYAIEDRRINSRDIVHVGDNLISDYLMAKRTGMGAVKLAKNNHGLTKFCSCRRVAKEDKAGYAKFVDFIQNHISNSWDDYFQFGYEVLGPLLYGFSKWLYEDVTAKGIKKIFFFSRDGYVIQKAFRELYGDVIENRYFYASRRSLRVPQLWIHPELEDVVDSFPNVSMLSIRAFFKNLGLEFEDFSDIAKKYGYMADDKIMRNAIASDERLCMMYSEIKEEFIANSKRESELLLQYMEQEGLEGRVAVVDIGWRGSLQYYLSAIVNEGGVDLQMHGYYIGLSNSTRPGISAQGYIAETDEGKMELSWEGVVGLAEFLFVSQEGSCKTYEQTGDKIRPKLYEYEYLTEKERMREADIALKIQDGALQFVHDAGSKKYDLDRKIAYLNLRNIGLFPSAYTCSLFGDIRFLEEKLMYFAKPAGILTYIKDPQKLKEDFYYSKWKIGFLKQLLKLPLPYKQLYELAKKYT